MTLQDWLQWLPTVICVFMAVGIFAGRNWMKARIERSVQYHFDTKIAALKHEQGIELARLRSDLDHLKDRGIRSNEREFQAIAGIWEGFVDAFYAMKGSIMPLIPSLGLTGAPEDVALEYLIAEGFAESHAARIVASENRDSAFGVALGVRLSNRASEAVLHARTALQKQCVFVPHPLSLQFEVAIDLLHAARTEQFMAQWLRTPGGQKTPKTEALMGPEGKQTFESLRDAVRDRLLRALDEDRKADSEIKAA